MADLKPESVPPDTSPGDVYSGVCHHALSMTPARRIELELPATREAPVWGILMEFGYPGASTTLFALADGHASLYSSKVGGLLGGGLHDNVRRAVASWIESANQCWRELTPTESFPAPEAEHVLFYALTDAGVRTGGGRKDDLGGGRHPLSSLYHAGHDVLTTWRLLGQKRLDPEISALYQRGIACAQRGEWDQAIAAFSAVIQREPALAEAYGSRGFVYTQKADLPRAIADFTEAIRLNPELAEAYKDRGRSYAKQGDADRAIADCTEALRLRPQSAEAYHNRGIGYVIQGDWQRAIADFSAAIRLEPRYAASYRNRGVAAAQQGHWDQALADYDEAIRLEPALAETYRLRGTAYQQKGLADKATADFRKAQELMRLAPSPIVGRSAGDRVGKKVCPHCGKDLNLYAVKCRYCKTGL